MAGITARMWWQLLREINFSVDPVYYHRAIFVSIVSVLNEFNASREKKLYESKIVAAPKIQAPVFILGHWRSGTTHLHNMLSQDTEQFAFPSTYQVTNPLTFLTTEKINSKLFAKLLPKKRPMDNMAMTFSLPQEDEFATLLTTLKSVYLNISFPRDAEQFEKYLSFKNASENDREEWRKALDYFLKKISLLHPNKTMLLKTPSHTARIAFIRSLYPDAKFIHIHRHPAEVYRSFQHYHNTAVWRTYLQKPDRSKVNADIIKQYRVLYESYFEDIDSIPNGCFTELSFEQLEKTPLQAMQKIYADLELPNITNASVKFETYLATLKNYEKNRFDDLTANERELLQKEWAYLYSNWGYQI